MRGQASIRAAVGYYFDPVGADSCPPDVLEELAQDIRDAACAGGECPGTPVVRRGLGAFYCRRCWAVGIMDEGGL